MHGQHDLVVILLLVAMVCELVAAAGVSSKVNLTALGLFFWFFSLLITAL